VSREREEDPEILPVLWQDNYFSLLPGETREVTARYRLKKDHHTETSVEVEGWNLDPINVTSTR
jgi:exo-1,4-beta-D-glucosaminidase